MPGFFAARATGPVTEFATLSFAGSDDGDVHVSLRFALTATATGREAAMNLHHFWRFRDGNIAFSRGSEDTALVASALGA